MIISVYFEMCHIVDFLYLHVIFLYFVLLIYFGNYIDTPSVFSVSTENTHISVYMVCLDNQAALSAFKTSIS